MLRFDLSWCCLLEVGGRTRAEIKRSHPSSFPPSYIDQAINCNPLAFARVVKGSRGNGSTVVLKFEQGKSSRICRECQKSQKVAEQPKGQWMMVAGEIPSNRQASIWSLFYLFTLFSLSLGLTLCSRRLVVVYLPRCPNMDCG